MLFNTKPKKAINIFYCYAHQDGKSRSTLANHLSNLRWQGYIAEWHNLDISPGVEWEDEITTHLDNADIILLLITPNFMASYYCHEVEMKRALERHKAKTARVIPIHLKYVDWENAPFSRLQALPTNAKPVSKWHDKDEAYYDICEGIKRVVNEFLGIPKKSVVQKSAPKRGSRTTKRSFAAEGFNTAILPQQKRALPIRQHEFSLGYTLYSFLKNFSYEAFKRRSKGYLSILMFTFVAADLLVLPYLVYNWTTSMIVGILSFALALILFIMATFSRYDAIGITIAFFFLFIWTAVGTLHIPEYFHILWPLPVLFLPIVFISSLRLLLFKKH